MIEHLPLFLVAFGGSLRVKSESTEEWKPSFNDTKVMREGMSKFQVEVINGKKQYPFEQYCVSEGIIGFTDNGQISVKSAFNWGRAIKTHALLQWENEKEMEKMFAAYPEEKEAYEAKLEVVKNQIRALFSSMKVAEL